MHLDSTQLQFLARFSKTPDGQFLIGVLQAKLKEVEANLRRTTGEEVYRCQGRALELDDLMTLFESADASLKRSASIDTSRFRRATI